MIKTHVAAADVRNLVREYIVENFLFDREAGRFDDAASFIEHQIIDSTGFLEVVNFIEAQYGLRIADEEMVPENLDSLAAIGAFVIRKLGS